MTEKVVKTTRTTASKEVVSKETEAPTTPEKRELLDTDKITIMNVTKGMYGYDDGRGFTIDLDEYGDTVEVTMADLRRMKASSAGKKHLNKPWIMILDNDVVEEFNLTKVYELFYTPERAKQLLRNSEMFIETFPKMTNAMQRMFLSLIRQGVLNNEYHDYRVIKWIKEETGTDVTV